jgi:hypothetical protein
MTMTTETTITETHIEAVYDAVTFMRLASQILSEGEIDDRVASEISWMLGSTRKRLEPIINLLELIQFEQEGGQSPADARPDASDAVLIGAEVLRLWEKFAARRRAVEKSKSGENS